MVKVSVLFVGLLASSVGLAWSFPREVTKEQTSRLEIIANSCTATAVFSIMLARKSSKNMERHRSLVTKACRKPFKGFAQQHAFSANPTELKKLAQLVCRSSYASHKSLIVPALVSAKTYANELTDKKEIIIAECVRVSVLQAQTVKASDTLEALKYIRYLPSYVGIAKPKKPK